MVELMSDVSLDLIKRQESWVSQTRRPNHPDER